MQRRGFCVGFLSERHRAISLNPKDRGETDLIQLTINTGDASSKSQPPRKMPFAVRQEVARQLKVMQGIGVVQPSSSPWSSPVVIV